MHPGLVCFTGVPDYSCPLPIHGTVLLLFHLTEITSSEGIIWGQVQASFSASRS